MFMRPRDTPTTGSGAPHRLPSHEKAGDPMPIISISIAAGRRPEQITALIREVTQAASVTLDAPLDTIKVIVTEVAHTHWGSGGQTLAEKRAVSAPADSGP